MLLLIMRRYLEVADRRMTTAIKLVFAHAFVSGATSLVYQLVRNRVLHRRPFPECGPSPPRLHFGSQLLLELLILADAHASALSVGGCGALGAQGTRVTRCRRKLGSLAGDHGDTLAPGQVTCIPAKSKVKSAFVNSEPPCGQGRAIMYTPCSAH